MWALDRIRDLRLLFSTREYFAVNLENFWQAISDSQIGSGIRESGLLFPWIETIHVLMVTTVVGTIAIVDLRLMGYGSHRRSARQTIVDLLPLTWGAFAIAVITGLLLFASNAQGYIADIQFLAKMLVLLMAGANMALFHLTSYQQIDQWDNELAPPLRVRIAGGLSLALWLVVIFLGRWIGFTVE